VPISVADESQHYITQAESQSLPEILLGICTASMSGW